MSSSVQQAREALGRRFRDLRKDAGLSGRDLAGRAGWHSSKVSKIEYGKQAPSDDDIRVWCEYAGATDEMADLLATARNIEAMYVEWRRVVGTGTRRRQEVSRELEAQTKLMRWYEPTLVPGILQTAEYAAAILAPLIEFYDIPDDLEAGVGARMERQQILYRGDHRFQLLLAEQVLYTRVGSTDVMAGQLDRLLAVISLTRVRLGIVPARAQYRVPTHNFIMFDDRLVHVETVSAELAISQPREIAVYLKAFRELSEQAMYGSAMRELITNALADVGRAG